MIKKVLTIVIASLLLLLTNTKVIAKDNDTKVNLKKEITYTANKLNESKDDKFKQKIKEKGKSYQLVDIDYELVKKIPLMVEKEMTKTIASEVLPVNLLYAPAQTIKEGNTTLTLVDVVKEEIAISEAYQQEVNAYTDYDYAVSSSNVPGTKQIQVTNNRTGELETVSCQLTNVAQQNNGEWKDTYIDVTFISWDATIFNWNGITVSKNEANPLNGYESQLLASVGADTENYRVLSTNWTSGAYTDNEGVLCRNARANVQRYVRYYRASYSGMINQEEIKGVTYKANYKGIEKIESKTEYKYDMKAIANYKEIKSNVPLIILGAAIVIFAGLMILLIMLLAKKRKEENKNEESTNLHN